MTDTIAPEFARFVAAARQAGHGLAVPGGPTAPGDVGEPIFVEAGQVPELLRVAARRAAGLVDPMKQTDVVWVDGGNELSVILGDLNATVDDGLVVIHLPVRCDQVRADMIDIAFAVGSAAAPAGLYASTYRRPNGSELVVSVWSDALIAFGWQCLLDMVAGIAGATGRDERGAVLVPVELSASPKGLQIVPMARHLFTGSTGPRDTRADRR